VELGISRRSFLQGVAGVAAAVGLPQLQGRGHQLAADGDRELMFNKWNFGPTPLDEFKSYVDEAASCGFTSIKVHVPWAKVVSRAGIVDYTLFDQQVDYVVGKGLRCAILIDLLRNFTDGQDAILTPDMVMVDPVGRPSIHPANQNLSQFAVASQTAVARAAEFVGAVAARYRQRVGDAVLFYETTLSQYAESEYWNGVWDPVQNVFTAGHYDYSTIALTGFRSWLATRYAGIGELNASWGTTYSSFGEVPAPTGFDGTPGIEWYVYRHTMLADALAAFADAVHGAGGGLRHSARFGSTYDAVTPWRGTILFPQLAQHSDAVHVDDAPGYKHTFAMDLLGGSLSATVWTGNELDGPSRADDATYLQQAVESFQHGATVMDVANWDLASLSARRSLFESIAALLGSGPLALDSQIQLNVSAATLLASGSQADQTRYDQLSANGTKRILVSLADDLTPIR
jgi:hypothetical protein